MDQDTLEYHLKDNEEKLSKAQVDVIKKVIFQKGCENKKEIEAVKALKNLVDPNKIHISSKTFSPIYAFPLIVGSISSIIVVITGIFTMFSETRLNTMNIKDEVLKLRKDNILYEEKYNRLKNSTDSLISLIDKFNQSGVSNKDTIKYILTNELANILNDSTITGKVSMDKKYSILLSKSIQNIENKLSKISLNENNLKDLKQNYESNNQRIENLESIVNENPNAIITLRLMQRDLENVINELPQKVDSDLLLEKEMRLTANLDKDFNALSRELSILRWVVYLLVIGLTASGGLIVVLQRRRE